MDRIIKSYVDDFWKQNSFALDIEASKIFEHFVNHTIIEPRIEDTIDIEDINIGDDNTIGIDGFALIVDKKLFTDCESLTDYLYSASSSSVSVEIYFIQSKTSSKFEVKEINGFGFAVNDFISQSRKLNWSEVAKERMKLFDLIFESSGKFKENPICYLCYVSLGRYVGDQNQESVKDRIIEDIDRENLFSKINFECIDTSKLQNRYKKLGQALQKSFEFEQKLTIPKINNVEESYLGLVRVQEIIKLITEDDNVIPNIFYDNVRDFQGANSVNQEIETALKSGNKDAFVILNNGITIVTEGLQIVRNTFTLRNYQVINGCQTSHVLYNNRNSINDSIYVTLKLISSNNADLTSQLIRSTNRQTAIDEQDLLAFSEFQRKLEDFYKTYIGLKQLFYERRSKQFRLQLIDKNRIIDKTTQIKVLGSFIFDKPETSTRYFGTLFREFKDNLFKDNHRLTIYYTASFALFRIQELLKKGVINHKYKKFKFFILMMLKYEFGIRKITLDSKVSEKDCESIIENIENDLKLTKAIESIIEKIESISNDFDLDSLETSKLKSLADRCKSFYFQ